MTQAKDIKISDNFFDETVNRDNDSIKKIDEQECDFINFCITCLHDAGYVSWNENTEELRGSEIMKHHNGWIYAAFNNEVKALRKIR